MLSTEPDPAESRLKVLLLMIIYLQGLDDTEDLAIDLIVIEHRSIPWILIPIDIFSKCGGFDMNLQISMFLFIVKVFFNDLINIKTELEQYF